MTYKLSQLLQQLSTDKVLTPQDREALENSALSLEESNTSSTGESADTTHTPWYINLLIGFSAWLSSLFMIGFLLAAHIIEFRHKASFLTAGLMFLGGGLTLYFIQRHAQSVFLNQMALALTMTGRILSIIGVSMLSKSLTTTSLFTIAMESVLIILYMEKLQRFLSTLLIHGSVFLIASHNKLPSLVYVYIAGLALLLYFLWVYEPTLPWPKAQDVLRPIGYGTAVALLGVMSFSTMPGLKVFLHVQVWWPITAVMGIIWLLACLSIAHSYRASLASPLALFIALTLFAFCATAYQAPGVTVACFILTLAYHQDEKLMAGLAILGLLSFVFFYYYGLRITLLQKSIAMLIPGLILLVARGVLLWMTRNTREATA